jgi:hypothetical protein
LDTGFVKLFDARVPGGAVAQHFLQRGLFDHAKVSDRTVVCGGLGGVLYVLDTRRFTQVQQRTLDPSLHSIHELSASAEGDLLAIGQAGFTLWKSEGKASLSFRALEIDNSCNTSANGSMHGSFVSPEVAITTNARGDFKQWKIKKMITRRPAITPRERVQSSELGQSPREASRAMHSPPLKNGRVGLSREATGVLPSGPSSVGRKNAAAAPTYYGSPGDTRGRYQHTHANPEAAKTAAPDAAAASTGAASEDSWDWDGGKAQQRHSNHPSHFRGHRLGPLRLARTFKRSTPRTSTNSSASTSVDSGAHCAFLGFLF